MKAQESDDVLSSQYASPILFDRAIYGCDGREDGGDVNYVCIDEQTGKRLWNKPISAISHSIVVDDRVLVMGIDGTLTNLSPSRDRWKANWTFQLPAGNYRPLPALSRNLLVIRSTDDRTNHNARWTAWKIGS